MGTTGDKDYKVVQEKSVGGYKGSVYTLHLPKGGLIGEVGRRIGKISKREMPPVWTSKNNRYCMVEMTGFDDAEDLYSRLSDQMGGVKEKYINFKWEPK